MQELVVIRGHSAKFEKEVKEKLQEGWRVFSSGATSDHQGSQSHWAHLVRETPDKPDC